MPRTGCRFVFARIPWIPEEAHEENPVLHEVEPSILCVVRVMSIFTLETREEKRNE